MSIDGPQPLNVNYEHLEAYVSRLETQHASERKDAECMFRAWTIVSLACMVLGGRECVRENGDSFFGELLICAGMGGCALSCALCAINRSS